MRSLPRVARSDELVALHLIHLSPQGGSGGRSQRDEPRYVGLRLVCLQWLGHIEYGNLDDVVLVLPKVILL